jgi:hypothetical protein
LGDDGDFLRRVDGEVRTIERRVAHAIRVEVAAGLVTSTLGAGVVVKFCMRPRKGSLRVCFRTGGSGASTLS